HPHPLPPLFPYTTLFRSKTFLSARGRLESRGGSSIFSIYRYKIADSPVELPPWEVFRERVANVIHGKAEVLKQKRLWTRTEGWRDRKSTRLNSSHVSISY